ncbi:MAG: PQQ-binding-like beta-propeller repeat protein, partial [Verrucomicrobiota bacterium]
WVMMMIKKSHLVLITFVMMAGSMYGGNWPGYRGVGDDGHAEGEGYPLMWSEEEGVVWKTPIHGRAWSSPVIWGDQVWMTTATEDGTEMFAICVDGETGEVILDEKLWDVAEPEPLSNPVNTYGSPSPVIEEGRVYLHFGSYGTVCIDTETMEEVWRRQDLECRHYRGPGSSPVIVGDLLVLTFDGIDVQYVVALDKATGETVWRTDRSTDFNDIDVETGKPQRDGDWRKGYNTPLVVEAGGKAQLVSPGAKAAFGYDLETGEEIWTVTYEQHSSASRPVWNEEEGLLYLNTGYGQPELWAIRMDETTQGDVTDSHVAWKVLKRMPKRSAPVLVGDRLYLLSDEGVVSCLDAGSGEVKWEERFSDKCTAAVIVAGGNLYVFDELGKGWVVAPGDEFMKVGEGELDEGMLASPAAVDGDLILRTVGHVYRVRGE